MNNSPSKNPLSKKGFTLLEIMIAVMIIGLLAAMATPAVLKARDRAQRGVCLDNQRSLNQALELRLFEHPDQENLELDDLTDYFSNQKLPECPSGGVYSLEGEPLKVSCSIQEHAL